MGSLDSTRLRKPWVQTPLIESPTLSKAAGCRVFCKLDNLQPSGSFKSRGLGNLCLTSLKTYPQAHFYCPSGGNAGLACVTAARSLSRPATVVVPQTTSPAMIAKIRAAGATEVIQVGASLYEADKYLREELLAHDPQGVYAPPFDNPAIWAGNGSLVHEVAAQMADLGERGAPDAVICSVGGGGLMAGIMGGLDAVYGEGKVSMVAVETSGADSLNASLKAGRNIQLDRISSKATSLGARKVADKAFEYGLRPEVRSVVVSDGVAAMGCWRFADDERILVELACGASVAMCYNGGLKKVFPQLTPESRVVLVVCGGVNVSLELLEEWRRVYGREVEEEMEAEMEMEKEKEMEKEMEMEACQKEMAVSCDREAATPGSHWLPLSSLSALVKG